MPRRTVNDVIASYQPIRITDRLAQLAIDLHLNSRQKRFAEALAADPNADQAEAYMIVTGEKDRAKASGRAAALMRSRKVKLYYREILESGTPSADRAHMRIMKAWEIRARLSEIARADYKDFVQLTPGGGFQFDLEGCIATGKSFLIKEVSHDPETGAPRVRLHDAMEALKVLAKIEGLMHDPTPPPTAAVQHRTLILNLLSQPDARRLMDDLGQRVLAASATTATEAADEVARTLTEDPE